MHDEFDDMPSLTAVSKSPMTSRRETTVARLACRLYGTAPPALRARLLACLVRPLGTLGMVGVAAGAFGVLLHRNSSEGARSALSDISQFSNDQVFELVRFVEQVSPDALQEFARLFTEPSLSMAAFSASAAWLLLRSLRTGAGSGATGVDEGKRAAESR